MTVRPPCAILNERSLPPHIEPLPEADALAGFSAFVDVLRGLAKIRPDLALVSTVPLSSVSPTETGLPFPALASASGGRAKDQWRYIQSRRNIAPIGAADGCTVPDLAESYTFQGETAEGLGAACASRQLAVSFAYDGTWQVEIVTLERQSMIEDGAGELEIQEETVELRHFSQLDHLDLHSEFVANVVLPEPFAGSDLWADRADRYPSLKFLPRVERQLAQLGAGDAVVQQVDIRLRELNQATAAWRPGEEASPQWASLVTGESATRRPLTVFTDFDGEPYYFEFHARFTPGAGRIHFRIVDGGDGIGFLHIAHIGLKL